LFKELPTSSEQTSSMRPFAATNEVPVMPLVVAKG